MEQVLRNEILIQNADFTEKVEKLLDRISCKVFVRERMSGADVNDALETSNLVTKYSFIEALLFAFPKGEDRAKILSELQDALERTRGIDDEKKA